MFKNLTIRAKLSLLILLMLVPLLYFVVNSIYVEANALSKLKQVENKLNESDKLSLLIHEIQRERAISNVFMASGGNNFSKRLQNQRKNTDVAIEAVRSFFNDQQGNVTDLVILNNLPVYRRQVDNLIGLQYDAYYLSLVEHIVSRIELHNTTSDDAQTRNLLQGYVSLINSKQRLGQLRNLVGRIIVNKGVNNEEFAEYRIQESHFNQQLEFFHKYTASNIREYYETVTANDTIRRTNELINLFKKPGQVNYEYYDPDLWYNNFTKYIDLIREVEVFYINQIKEQLQEQVSLRTTIVWIYSIMVLLVVVAAVGFALYFLQTTSHALQQLKMAADKVAVGETDIALQVTTGDEIGVLARSFNSLVSKNIYLSELAGEIGKGNYSQEVVLAGPNDRLGGAIRDMQINLKHLSEENARRHWMLTGNNMLDDAIRGVKTLEKLSGVTIAHIVKYINAQLGGMYILNEQSKLEFANGYAFNVSDEVAMQDYAVGEGPLGQALAGNEVIVLEDIKQEHLKIKSGLLDVVPASVAFVPLRFGEELVGAIEIAKKERFEAHHLEFLNTIKEKIAMVILSLKADLKTAELLYETQNQAEELETQQEELRQINDELREQSIRLQASEEELKTNQEELMEKNAELEEKANQLEEQYEAIRVKNSQLEEARDAISTKVKQVETISKYKSEFLANMSHELRTPLNSILILAKLIEENRENNLTPKQVEFASVIHNSGTDLLKLINEILDLAKIESGKINLDLRDVYIKSLEVQSMFSQLAKEKNIDFSVHFAENLPESIHTDEFRLQQILRNLLSNAFKFTPAGGQVVFNIGLADQGTFFFNDKLLKADKVIAFEIKDTGIGIPEDKQQIVFEAFQQADTSTTRKFGGTGLGLSISRELAALLGGEIQLHSKENEGSTFTLYLPQTLSVEDAGHLPESEPMPLSPVNALPVATAGAQEFRDLLISKDHATSRKERLILIIEDDKGFSKILADFSKDRNFNVMTTTSGREGVKLAKQHKPDAILLDIQLPDISGWEVLEQIKKDRTISHTPVHVMSAYDSDVLQKGISSEDFLPKPITLEMLDKAFNKIQQGTKQLQQILIIEDNETENKAITELLLAHEMHSESAHTGVEALQLLEHRHYDCIILDINLPDMEGFELLEQLRNKEGYKDIPVVIYSGRDLTESEEFRLKKHANTIIIKTMYSYTRLLEEVKLFLHKVQEKIPVAKETQLKLHRPEVALQGKKVLIVDDDSRNIYSLYNIFEGQQMEIIVANDGQEALDQLDQNPDTDIVLMDIMMPVMDGMECMRRIRKQPRFNKLPIIALTAKAMKGDREKSIEAGASDYIPKPVDVDKLLSLMRVWLYDSKAGI